MFAADFPSNFVSIHHHHGEYDQSTSSASCTAALYIFG